MRSASSEWLSEKDLCSSACRGLAEARSATPARRESEPRAAAHRVRALHTLQSHRQNAPDPAATVAQCSKIPATIA